MKDSLEILGFVCLDVWMDKGSEFDIGESFGQVCLTQKYEGAQEYFLETKKLGSDQKILELLLRDRYFSIRQRKLDDFITNEKNITEIWLY